MTSNISVQGLYELYQLKFWFLAPELSSTYGVFQLLHRPLGTLFRHICARHQLVADSLEMG